MSERDKTIGDDSDSGDAISSREIETVLSLEDFYKKFGRLIVGTLVTGFSNKERSNFHLDQSVSPWIEPITGGIRYYFYFKDEEDKPYFVAIDCYKDRNHYTTERLD